MDIKPCNILITRKPNPKSGYFKSTLMKEKDNPKFKDEFI